MVYRSTRTSLIIFAFAYILWGLNTPLIKVSLEIFPLLLLLFLKFTIGGLFFAFVSHKKWIKLSIRHWWRIILATVLGYTLTSVFVYQGIKETGGLNSALIYLIVPLLLYALSIKVLKDKFSSQLLFGVVAGLIGAVFIVAAPLMNGESVAHGNLHGNVLILCGAMADALGVIIIKPILEKIPTLQIVTARFVVAAVSILPFAWPQLHHLTSIKLSPGTTAAILFNFIGGTIIAYYLYHTGLKAISVEQSSPLSYLQPVVGAVASILLLKEYLTTPIIAGMFLVILAVYYSETKIKYNRPVRGNRQEKHG